MTHISAAALGALIGALLVFPIQAANAARDALAIWAQAVVPGLEPFMVCVLLLVPRIGGGMPLRVGLAWLGGSPGGARLMQEEEQAQHNALHYAAITGTMSPMFFLSTLSGWLGNVPAGWLLLVCHLIGAFLTGRCFPCAAVSCPAIARSSEIPGIGSIFRDTALALGTIGVCMMLGSTAAKMAALALPFLSDGIMAALQCCLEITAGAQRIVALNSAYTLPLLCAACSFGGLSILLQNLAFWQKAELRFPQLLGVRAVHALISGTLCLLASKFL